MFNIEPQMRYTIFDMETSTFFKYGYAPISKIESGYTVKGTVKSYAQIQQRHL